LVGERERVVLAMCGMVGVIVAMIMAVGCRGAGRDRSALQLPDHPVAHRLRPLAVERSGCHDRRQAHAEECDQHGSGGLAGLR
jgi:hypothetical protein